MKEKQAKADTSSFESSLERLQGLVSELEQEGITLDQALNNFETGVKIVRNAQETLAAAHQSVQVLIEKDHELSTEELDKIEDDE